MSVDSANGETDMARFTEKYVRTESKWVKITRDNQKRTFTFAVGYKGEFTAHDVQELPFKWVANWTEALEKANTTLSY